MEVAGDTDAMRQVVNDINHSISRCERINQSINQSNFKLK
jgi:hypothetical protein